MTPATHTKQSETFRRILIVKVRLNFNWIKVVASIRKLCKERAIESVHWGMGRKAYDFYAHIFTFLILWATGAEPHAQLRSFRSLTRTSHVMAFVTWRYFIFYFVIVYKTTVLLCRRRRFYANTKKREKWGQTSRCVGRRESWIQKTNVSSSFLSRSEFEYHLPDGGFLLLLFAFFFCLLSLRIDGWTSDSQGARENDLYFFINVRRNRFNSFRWNVILYCPMNRTTTISVETSTNKETLISIPASSRNVAPMNHSMWRSLSQSTWTLAIIKMNFTSDEMLGRHVENEEIDLCCVAQSGSLLFSSFLWRKNYFTAAVLHCWKHGRDDCEWGRCDHILGA